MLSGSELEIAIAVMFAGAVGVGILLHWLWQVLGQSKTDTTRLAEMAERLHEADMALEAAEEARQQAEAELARRESETAEQIAMLQARLDGQIEDRDADLERQLSETRTELEVMRDGLGNARKRISELEAKLEALKTAGD